MTRAGRSVRSGAGGITLVRLIGVGLGALVLSVLVLTQGLASVVARGNPELALRIAPNNGRAWSRLAERRMTELPPEQLGRVTTIAREALLREPLSVASATLLSVDATRQGDTARANWLLDYASHLSRRNLPTQLLLIERAVTRQDAGEALRQFDITLRTSQASFPTLFPILANAIADPYFLAPMRRIAREDPSWFPFFVGEAVTHDAALLPLARIMAAAPDTATGRNAELRQNLLDRLMATGQAAIARRYYAMVYRDARGPLLDPRFARPDLPPPFGWRLANEPDLSAAFERGTGIGYVASSDRGGTIASQVTTLAPGRYRLVLTGKGGLRWRIACLGRPDALPQQRTAGGGRLAVRFAVPAGCPAQLLALDLAPVSRPEGQEGQITGLSITREGA